MKNLITYKNFLLEKDNTDESDIMKKLFVDDPNNPLDKSINSVLERFTKKTDIYTKTDEGKEIYTAKMYRQLKAVDLNEIVIQKKNKYFIEKKKEEADVDDDTQGQGQGQGQVQTQEKTNILDLTDSEVINEGFLKKMFDFAVKKTKLYASKIKASKKIDPIFDGAKQEIEKLFNDKNLVESYEKANSDHKALVAKLEEEAKKLKTELETTTNALGDAMNKKAQQEKGENAFKKGEIYTYEKDGKNIRVVVTEENPLKIVRVSSDDHEKVKENEPRKTTEIGGDKAEFEIQKDKDKLSQIGKDFIGDVKKRYQDQIDKVNKIYNDL